MLALRVAERVRTLDQHVAERGRALRLGPQNLARKPTVTGTGLHHDERVRSPWACHHWSSAPATHAPNSGPTSGW